MSYFDVDAQEMLEIYLLESRQLIGQMNDALLEAEGNRRFSENDIHNIFRVMHTVKSSSAMMGLNQMSSLTHKLEDIFDYYREQQGQILEPEQELFDLLFEAADFIAGELDRMEAENYQPADTSGMEEKAEGYQQRFCTVAGEQGGQADSAEEQSEPDDIEYFQGRDGTVVKVVFETGCRMENVRAFMLIRQISPQCSSIETYPQDVERSQESAEFISENGFYIRFVSEQKEEVLTAIHKGLFVYDVKVLQDKDPVSNKEDQVPEKTDSRSSARTDDRENEILSVKVERLDKLQNLSSELMIHMLTLEEELDYHGLEDVKEGTAHQINRLIMEVERTVMLMRMVPVNRIVPRLRRILRDMCRDQGKDIDFVINCGDVEADKSIIDSLSESLMHLIRNAVDHGIEPPEVRTACGKSEKGIITFTVEGAIGELILTISDDGQGLDEGKIRETARERGLLNKAADEYSLQELFELILQPGFTTNDTVTEYSGRGVGLDVVNNILEDVGGHLYIESEAGKGSSFIMTVPLTLATMECVRFSVGDYRFSMPARHVFRFLKYDENKNHIRKTDGRNYILYEDRMIPLIDLHQFYCIEGAATDHSLLVYVKGPKKEGCIQVDSIFEQKRVVIKPLPALCGSHFRQMTGIGGCSIMGDGVVCAALDLEIIIDRYEKEGTYGR